MIIVHIAECSHFYAHTQFDCAAFWNTHDEWWGHLRNTGWTQTTETHCCPASLLLALANSYFLSRALVALAEYSAWGEHSLFEAQWSLENIKQAAVDILFPHPLITIMTSPPHHPLPSLSSSRRLICLMSLGVGHLMSQGFSLYHFRLFPLL